MIDNKTPRLGLPLPHPDNYLEDDAARLGVALSIIDSKVATLGADNKVPVDQLPAVAITDTFPVSSEAEMLALNAQSGDVAIRSDLSKSFILMAEPASTLANWKELVSDVLVQLNTSGGAAKVRTSSGKTVQEEIDGSIANEKLLMRLHFGKFAQEIGCTLSTGSFQDGATITSATQLLIDESARRIYGLAVAVPVDGYVVDPGADPTQGADWVDVTDESLRGQLAAVGSQVLIGGVKAGTIAANISSVSFKNKIVDGRFDFWYEGTYQTSSGYGSDTMWRNENIGSTKTHSRQALNPDADLPAIHAPSAKYFSRTVVSSVAAASNYVAKITKIENVRTLAGKKATLSFYAKADAAKNIAIELSQRFGTGGTPSNDATGIGSQLVPLSSSWTRYSIQIDVPSVEGKVLGTNADDCLVLAFWFDAGSNFLGRAAGLGHQSGTFDIACVQLEEGEQATKFEELPMSISENLVGRYYETNYPYGTPVGTPNAPGGYREFTHPKATGMVAGAATQFRVPKREIPTVSIFNRVTGAKDRVYAGGSLIEVMSIGAVGKNGFASMNVTTLKAGIDVSFYYVADARL